MRSLQRFWQALESMVGPAGVSAHWRATLGPEYEWARPFLRPQGELAASYPRLDDPFLPPFRVVTHGPDDHVGVCHETGDRIVLSTPDLVVYELDYRALARAVAVALGFELMEEGERRGTQRIGTFTPVAGRRHPVYLTIPLESDDLLDAVHQLSASPDRQFLLLTPTQQLVRPAVEEALRRKRSIVMALCDALATDASGKLCRTEAAATLLNAFRQEVLSAPKPEGDRYIFRKQGEVWVLTFEDETVFMEDARGMHYLAYLIANQGKIFHVAALLAAVSGREEALARGSAEEVVDPEAMAAYKDRLIDLQDQLAEAEEFNDIARQESLDGEFNALLSIVSAATGLGGKCRRSTAADRVRKTVANAMTRSLNKIARYAPALARHLDCSISRGRFLSYRPEQPLPWVA